MRSLVLPLVLCVLLVSVAGHGTAQEKYADPALTPADREHWAFRRPVRPEIPNLKQQVANPIDAFILARLQKEALKPSPEADRITLIRRATLDLTGWLPTPVEVDAFLKDKTPDAYEKVVDRLLASPHFGERWAQHWLDVARFAESNGFGNDATGARLATPRSSRASTTTNPTIGS